jgi:aminopeptidase-like protein
MNRADDFHIGHEMHGWAQDLWPIPRSLTGEGVRHTLAYLQNILPELTIHSVPTGTQVFDWQVPEEWFIEQAYIENERGERIIDFATSNLHVLGYSIPVDAWFSLDELKKHLHVQPDQPDAIPYVTSYYEKRWGFCLTRHQLDSLPDGHYHAVIKSELKQGVLNYGELLIKGKSQQEVLLSTYICHPSMANNELSGPIVTTALAQWLLNQPELKYSYRIVFIPETIGSITYLSQHLDHLKKHVIAGFNISCVGDERCYSYLPSRKGTTLSDLAAQHVLKHIDANYKKYSWLNRGSDERQYCAPGIDLPMATIMRSKYGEYPEYHTSLDDLSLVTPEGLKGGYEAIRQALEVIEKNSKPKILVLGEPQLARRGLYPSISQKGMGGNVRDMMNIISYCDGLHTTLEIAEQVNLSFFSVYAVIEKLAQHNLIELSGGTDTHAE